MDNSNATRFVSPQTHLRLPAEWRSYLERHGAMYLVDNGDSVAVRCLSSSFYPCLDWDANILGLRTNSTISINCSCWDATKLYLPDQSLAWYLDPRHGRIEVPGEVWAWVKGQVDGMFGTVNSSQSCLIVRGHAWELDVDDDIRECGTIEVQYNHRDGSPHHWQFYSPRSKEDHWSLDSGDGTRLEGGQHPNFGDSEIRELDTPDVVFEVVTSLSPRLGRFIPDLCGLDRSQVKALTQRAATYLSQHGNEIIRFGEPVPRITLPDLTRDIFLTQLIFLLKGRLSLHQVADIIERKVCSSDECASPTQDCVEISIFLSVLQDCFVQNISFSAMHFVLSVLSTGALTSLTNPNNRHERMQMWTSRITSPCLSRVFSILSPGINIVELLSIPEWVRYLTIILARLADELLLFQLAQSDLFIVFPETLVLFGQFYNAYRGRDVGRHLEIPAEMPVPVHESIEHFLSRLMHGYKGGKEGDEEMCFAMELSGDLFEEEREKEDEETQVCFEDDEDPEVCFEEDEEMQISVVDEDH